MALNLAVLCSGFRVAISMRLGKVAVGVNAPFYKGAGLCKRVLHEMLNQTYALTSCLSKLTIHLGTSFLPRTHDHLARNYSPVLKDGSLLQ